MLLITQLNLSFVLLHVVEHICVLIIVDGECVGRACAQAHKRTQTSKMNFRSRFRVVLHDRLECTLETRITRSLVHRINHVKRLLRTTDCGGLTYAVRWLVCS